MKLSSAQKEALHITETVKFLATADANGKINVAPIISTDYYKEDQLIFGDFLMWKTKQNLQKETRLAVLVIDQKLDYFIIKGSFMGFAAKGEAFEYMNNTLLFKYNAYTGVRSAGLINIESVAPAGRLSKINMAASHLVNMLQKSDHTLNPTVMEKYARLQSVKALAWMSEKGPEVSPVTIIRTKGNIMEFYNDDCPALTQAALTVITMDPVSYQVKGNLRQQKGKCQLEIEEIYSGGLPLPGERIL